MLSPEKLLELDRQRVWHPYAPMPGKSQPLVVESASGVRLRLADGRELIDGMSSWWAAIHGYRHPVLDAAARDPARVCFWKRPWPALPLCLAAPKTGRRAVQAPLCPAGHLPHRWGDQKRHDLPAS